MNLHHERRSPEEDLWSRRNLPKPWLNGRNPDGDRDRWAEEYPIPSCVLFHSDLFKVVGIARANGIPFDYELFLKAMQRERFTPFSVQCNGQQVFISNFAEVVAALTQIYLLMHPSPKWNHRQVE